MKSFRFATALVGFVLMAGGYFASQAAYFNGDPAPYYRSVNQSSIPMLSLVVLAGGLFLVVLSKPEAE
ncbi:MAG: hypothetical protein JNM34_05840 [Chthonomonadaceae bacterium]|jgi:hypothetical protein|nr:hypothetical protein [Chthonomonadaceae bacterium]